MWRRALIVALPLLIVAGCARPIQAPNNVPATPASVSPPTTVVEALPDLKFAAFVRDFRATAIAAGVSPSTYDRAMADVTRNPRVEQLNAEQPEFTVPVWTYLDHMVSDRRVAAGRQKLLEYAPALAAIEAKYGIPREILLAIWGDESDYGEGTGGFNMFQALATLAYDGPRIDYARRELITALKMMEQEHYDPAQMTSSWAGAFGQTQFVPSSFLAHAVDGDGDGKIDLWNSPADALASAAHLLADYGWQRGNGWGYEVRLPLGFDYALADLDAEKPVAEWTALGVTTISGAALPSGGAPAAIYLPAGARGPAFLVTDNFKVILKYNNAASYALAISTLADRIRGEGPIVASWPRDEQPLAADERLAFQTALKALGFDPGNIDGIVGRGTRAALRAWQKAHGFVADGFPTKTLLGMLEQESTIVSQH